MLDQYPEGWQYRDIPRVSVEVWDEFMGVIEGTEYKQLTFAQYPHNSAPGGIVVRGQFMFSPDTMEKLQEWYGKLQSEKSVD